jgi:DNA-binding transcriptional LysR family regulator
MNKLRAMALFVRLADLGSFTRVAAEVGASKSMISKEIARLEAEVGARLIHRSTRNVRLTDIGTGYLQRCRKLLLLMEDADSYVQDMQNKPRGRLKVNASMALGITDLGRCFAEFMERYPEIELDVHLTDEPVELIEQGFDLGLRAASRQFDSPYIGRRLIQFRYHVCATPAYLAAHPPIRAPEDLRRHNCFVYSYFRGGSTWPYGEGVPITGSLRVNSTIFMREAVVRGLGIGMIPSFIVKDAIRTGQLVDVLPEHPLPKLTLYALYPDRQFAPPKLTLCIRFLRQWFERNYPE